MNISVNIKGVDGLKKNLRQFAANVETESAAMNAKTAIEILADVRQTLRYPTSPGQFGADTGDLSGRYHVKTVRSTIGGGAGFEPLSAEPGDPKNALVGAVSDHVLPVELGRAPGSKPPPPGALTDWLRRHGLPESIEYVVAQSIARRGILAQPHLHPAIERARAAHLKNLANGIDKAAKPNYKPVLASLTSEGS